MSKDRRNRRAAREVAQPRPADRRAGADRDRSAPGRPGRPRLPGRQGPPKGRAGRARTRKPRSLLTARRRRQNLALVAVLLLLNVLLWTQVSDTGLRLVAAALSVLSWPLLVTVVFDRRSW